MAACPWSLRCVLVTAMVVTRAEFAAVPPVCCPADGSTHIPSIPDPRVMGIELDRKLYLFEETMRNSLLMDVERRSLVLAGFLVSVTMVILLVGTCIVSCRFPEADPHYELVAKGDWEEIAVHLLRTEQINFKNHLYAKPFRDFQEET